MRKLKRGNGRREERTDRYEVGEGDETKEREKKKCLVEGRDSERVGGCGGEGGEV